jgi:hypothetical protein
MNNRGTIAGIVVFLAGLVGLWWAEKARIPTHEEILQNRFRVLPGLARVDKPDDVRRIEISGGAKPLAFERRPGNRWQMVEPLDVAADPTIVEGLAFNLKMLERVRDSGTLDESPSSYGLAPASRTIRLLGGEDGKTPLATLEVGSVNRDSRYVRPEGFDGIQIVPAKLISAVDLPVNAWRDRTLVRLPSFQARTITATRPDRKLELERDGELWKMVEPYKALADDNRVEGVLAEIGSLRVADGDAGFVANDVKDLAPYGLDKPSLSVSVGLKSQAQAPQTLHLGRPAPNTPRGEQRYYARQGDQDDVVLVDPRLIRDLGVNPSDLHGKKLADLAPANVSAVRLGFEGGGVCAVRRGKGWERVEPLVDKADAALVEELVKRLSTLEASTLFDPAKAPDPQLDKPWGTIEVWQDPAGKGGDGPPAKPETKPGLKLALGRRDGASKTVYARVEGGGDETIYALPSGFLDGLIFGRLAFRDRQVSGVPAPSIERIATTHEGRTVLVVAPTGRMEPTAWRLKDPAEAPADPETVARVLQLLSNLRAESFVTDQPASDVAYGFDKPEVVVRWTTKSEAAAFPLRPKEAEQTVLTVGKFATNRNETRYARVSTSPIVFTLGLEAVAALGAEWRDRQVMAFTLKNAERLALKWPNLTLSARPVPDLKTGEPDWTLVNPPDRLDFDATRLKGLVKSLSKLNTFRYAQYDGPIKPETGLLSPKLVIGVQASGGLPRELRLGNRSKDGYLYATTETGNSGLVFLLPLGAWEPWEKPPAIRPEPAKGDKAKADKPK